ncbi:cytochrome P450 [Mucidula mucida]|nr:cytochrome P450 [Mucidula mucida]
MPTTSNVISALGFWALIVFSALYIFSRRSKHLPPGPGIRSLLQLTSDNWLDTFLQWKRTYGSLTYLNLAGTGVLVFHTHKAAADLMDRRSSIYSSRPRLIVALEILCGNMFPGFMPYNDLYIRTRKVAHEAIHSKEAAQIYRPIQQKEALLLCRNLLTCSSSSHSWEGELERATTSVMLSILYNHPTLSSTADAPIIAEVKDLNSAIAYAAFPGTYLVEFFPWMKYLPSSIAPWKRKAEAHSKRATKTFVDLFLSVDDSEAECPSFSGLLARGQPQHKLSNEHCAWLTASLLVAGVDAVHGTIGWLILALVLNPSVQAQCQKELDAVVGRERPPSFEDLERLQYVRAAVKECIRWNLATPFGIPHLSTQDDWYEGQFIPKGTICIPNVVGMNRDPEVYGEDAHEFNPSRFLDESGRMKKMASDTRDEGHASFGFGRRICLGRYVANDTLFIYTATLLWAFTMHAENPPSPDQYVFGGVVM